MRSVGMRWVVLGLALCGCGVSLPEEYPVADEPVLVQTPRTTELPAEAQDLIRQILREQFGSPASPTLSPEAAKTAGVQVARLEQGATLYRQHCMHCHGLAGDGRGPTAPFLFPKPRDYRAGIFKFTSTPRTNNQKPTRDDLRNILRIGAVGTSMPSFVLLPEEEIEAIIDYVIHLSIRGEVEMLLAIANQADGTSGEDLKQQANTEVTSIARSWGAAEGLKIVPPSPPPPVTAASIEKGRILFESKDAQCSACHGVSGRGDGPSAEVDPVSKREQRDEWGAKNPPANLTLGLYRGGRRPIDLYRRIYSGVKGATMPELQSAFKSTDDLWSVVHYVYSIPYRDAVETKAAMESTSGGH